MVFIMDLHSDIWDKQFYWQHSEQAHTPIE